jgi:hypothetical protein
VPAAHASGGVGGGGVVEIEAWDEDPATLAAEDALQEAKEGAVRREARADELQDLELAFRQVVRRAGRGRRLGREPRPETRVQIGLAGDGGAVRSRALEDLVVGAADAASAFSPQRAWPRSQASSSTSQSYSM